MSPGAVIRRAAFVEHDAFPYFAWTQEAPEAAARDLVAVVCAPIGSEYTRSHRSLRHLADRLARAGIPAVRFDYHGTGDSPGTDLDPHRAEAWLANIVDACRLAREWSGRTRVVLVGVRLGGTLAALASEAVEPEGLVLWNAPAKGRPYVRELQAIAMTAARAEASDDTLEAAGFVLTAETLAAVKRIDLTQAPVKARHALLVARDDLTPDATLAERFAAQGIATETLVLPGWHGMMADHQHTVVPDAALDAIVAHVVHWDEANRGLAPVCTGAVRGRQAMAMSFVDEERAAPATVDEEICTFGEDGHLFGVLTRGSRDPDRPAIVMFNGGAVHHVGPNRVYVTLARSLAAMGFACLRFDLEGIGDSVLRGPGRENHPYPQGATADARAAIEYLRREHGYSRFVALGLCSGAHTAFHTALQDGEGLEELVLINPYAFYWREGMSLDTASLIHDTAQYKKSMRDPSRWLKLLRGDVNLRRLLQVAIQRPATIAKSYYGSLCEKIAPSMAPPLARDLRRLFERRRGVTVLVAEGDPGHELIMSEARWTAARGVRDGRMRMETIPGGDHTFTQSRPRRELLHRVASHLRARLAHPVVQG